MQAITVCIKKRVCFYSLHHFFFQAEDGIRDYKVTGVQTCALPISSPVGHHLSDAQPEILRESLEIGGRWGEIIGREIQDSLARSGGPSADFALQSQMKSDLRNLITAEEAFFADSIKYTTTIGVGGVDYRPSADNRILELRLTKDGWVATMGNAKTKTICAIFVGSTPLAPAVEEGRPACQVRPM